ncbi:MAG: hypothetical protein M1819_004745 [Sarea resinae]|nr:MAG: hypothetical protein M1819_004745 [Sarea resinae]
MKHLDTNYHDFDTSLLTSDMQAIVLLEMFAKYRSRRPVLTVSQAYSRLYLSLVRDNQRLLADPLAPFRALSTTFADENGMQAAWSIWLELETRRRVFISAFILKTQHEALFELDAENASTPSESIHLPLPCSDILWNCSYFEWSLIASAEQSNNLPFAAISALNRHLSLDDFQSLTVLSYFACSGMTCSEQEDLLGFGETLQSAPLSSASALLSYDAFLLVRYVPIRDLLAVSGESWILGRKLSLESEFEHAKRRLRVWVDGDTAKRAVSCAVHILNIAFTRRPHRTGLLHEQWILYLAALVCWSYNFSSSAMQPSSSNLALSTLGPPLNDYEQNTQRYLTAFDTGSWKDIGHVSDQTYIDSLLQWVRSETSAPALSGLLNEASGVLAKLIDGRSVLSNF